MNLKIDTHTAMTDISREVAKHTESLILEQLNDFISRGLIVVEHGPISFVEDVTLRPGIVSLRQTVSLKLKDREYIESLEKENRQMRQLLDKIRSGILE